MIYVYRLKSCSLNLVIFEPSRIIFKILCLKMDITRNAFEYRIRESLGEERGSSFCLSYGRVVWASSNHNIMFKLLSFCNVQSLEVLKMGVLWAFRLVLFLCKEEHDTGLRQLFVTTSIFGCCGLHMNTKTFGWELPPIIGAIVFEYLF